MTKGVALQQGWFGKRQVCFCLYPVLTNRSYQEQEPCNFNIRTSCKPTITVQTKQRHTCTDKQIITTCEKTFMLSFLNQPWQTSTDIHTCRQTQHTKDKINCATDASTYLVISLLFAVPQNIH
jgi:hypothetical protein